MPYCPTCRAQYTYGEKKCPSCGVEFPYEHQDQPPTTAIAEPERSNTYSDLPVASRGKRVFAALIDLGIVVALILPLWRYPALRVLSKYLFFLTLLPAAYLVLKDSLGGKSIGKLLVGITVVNMKENKIAGIGDSFLRNSIFAIVAIPIIGWAISVIISIVMLIQILLGKECRLGDVFANTKVVEDRALEAIS